MTSLPSFTIPFIAIIFIKDTRKKIKERGDRKESRKLALIRDCELRIISGYMNYYLSVIKYLNIFSIIKLTQALHL
jgi:hypothetical protein